MKKTTLCFLLRSGEILLAEKKRGFGAGKTNGVGGKVHEGESVKNAAVREAREEVGVEIDEKDLEHWAILTFMFPDDPRWNQECHVFLTKVWEGDPYETEEMNPRWYKIDKIPFSDMWKGDPIWLPHVLQGKKARAIFHFSSAGEVLAHEVAVVENL